MIARRALGDRTALALPLPGAQPQRKHNQQTSLKSHGVKAKYNRSVTLRGHVCAVPRQKLAALGTHSGAGGFDIAKHRQKRDKQNEASGYGHRGGKTSFQSTQEDGRWGGWIRTGPARHKNQRSFFQLGGTPC